MDLKSMDLRQNLPGLNMKNPVMPASGCFGFGREAAEFYDLSLLGAIVMKSATLEPRAGNSSPRVAETCSGMLNAIGLQNKGVDRIIKEELPWLAQFNTPVIANVAGGTEEEYVQVVERLNESSLVNCYELNISCPNVKHGGIGFGTEPKLAEKVTAMVKKVANKPVYVKLSPNVTDIVEIAKAVQAGGADGLVLINTVIGMSIDLKRRTPLLGNITGGLSGPAIKPVALRMVYQVANCVNLPIIGVGGIDSAESVIEFLNVGARAVQVGAQNLVDPMACPKIIDELPEALAKYGYKSVKEAVGVCLK